MPEIVKYLQNEEIIFIEGFGIITYNDVKSSIEQGIKYGKEFQIKNVLSDHIKVESVPKEVDVFNLGSVISQKLKEFSIALVYPESLRDYYFLLAKAANKRGGNIKLFENRNAALSWLNSQK